MTHGRARFVIIQQNTQQRNTNHMYTKPANCAHLLMAMLVGTGAARQRPSRPAEATSSSRCSEDNTIVIVMCARLCARVCVYVSTRAYAPTRWLIRKRCSAVIEHTHTAAGISDYTVQLRWDLWDACALSGAFHNQQPHPLPNAPQTQSSW